MSVHFVGAGPGAADLLTVRATRLLSGADVVVYPGTYLDPEVLNLTSPTARHVDSQHLDLDQIVAVLVDAHRAGRSVVRLASGDLSVYSALSEQTARLDAAGVPWDVTPGVPAYAAAAALVGTELTVPMVTQSVVLTRAHGRATTMPEHEDLSIFARTRATLVLHLGITRIGELMTQVEGEYGADCPVVVVHRASQPGELVLRGTVSTIADVVREHDLRQAAVILVGPALAPEHPGESHLYDPRRQRCRPVHGTL